MTEEGVSPFLYTEYSMSGDIKKIAVIDVGSNSTRLLIAGVHRDGSVEPLHTDLITTRLGEGINEGLLLPGAMERTVQAMACFKTVISNWNVHKLVVTATSAVRDAANRQEFIDLVRFETGYKIMVLSGPEEAFFSYYGVGKGLGEGLQGLAVVDVGGGSTEFTWTERNSLVCGSTRVGAVRMTEGGHTDGKIIELLMPVLAGVKKSCPAAVVGVGGTITNLAAMDLKLTKYDPDRVHGHRLYIEGVHDLLEALTALGTEERKKLPGLQPARADIIVAGSRIILLIMKELGLPYLIVSETDLLYGLASDSIYNVERKNVIHYQ